MCVPSPANPATRATGRARLWDLPASLHCSVIGTCVPTSALRRLFRKAEGQQPDMGDYALHRLFVQAASGGFRLSRLTQRYLEDTYRASITRFSRVRGSEALQQLWQEALDNGGVAGAYWALLSHRDCTPEIQDLAAGEIHMLSHEAGRVWQEERLRRQRLEADRDSLRQQLQSRQQECHRLHGEVHRLQQRCQELDCQLRQRDSQPSTPQALPHCPKNAALRQRIQVLEERLQAQSLREQQQQQTLQRLQAQLAEQQRCPMEQTVACGQQHPSCENLDLCGRCILYVGGRHAHRDRFRRVVEQCNGRFLHHDGGREDGHQRLRALLQQADTVLCPLNCVSHQAMGEIKQLCQRQTKPVKLLEGYSLSAFTAALAELSP